MNQIMIGKFIAIKRKEKNLTQEQLAEKLGVSNKTISKWENGKCMPDYSVVESLCKELEITIAELMDGEVKENNSIRVFDEAQMIDMLERIQNLEQQKQLLLGVTLILLGIAMMTLSQQFGGAGFRSFVSGLLLGLSCGESIIGVFIIGRAISKK
ncbi:helix-turn-helix domain-containing protein [Anaerosporobacter sp.]|uniref:helix-turn-helix domain-containing protein n=1 Tax=Anaerosporobacter sp. TaxID=1872529 RepID=UPI00286F750E|nr:helix-turn-helix transcriptional regulator [Anaerosporobacter sp.]